MQRAVKAPLSLAGPVTTQTAYEARADTAIERSPLIAAQRRTIDLIANSPRIVAQRKHHESVFGGGSVQWAGRWGAPPETEANRTGGQAAVSLAREAPQAVMPGQNAPVVYQRVITPGNKKKIGQLTREQVIARMRNPLAGEEPGEIATAYLVANGYPHATPEQTEQWIALIRASGLLDGDSDISSEDESLSEDDRDDDEEDAAPLPRPIPEVPHVGGAAAAAVVEAEAPAPAPAPTLTDLAKRQLDAAVSTHNARETGNILQAPTMGVGRYRSTGPDEQPRVTLKTSNQRNLPGTGAQARLDGLEVLPAVTGSYPNMHAEMIGTMHSIHETLGGTPTKLEEMGASQEICFLCELVMTTLGVAYDEAHISRVIYPKWEDPTGRFGGEDGGYLSLSEVLRKLGVSEEDAKARLVTRLSSEMSEEDAEAFATRILAGELQGGAERRKLASDLKKVPSLAQANQRKGGGGRARKASAGTKAGRREKREQAKRRSELRKKEAAKKDGPKTEAPKKAPARSTRSASSSSSWSSDEGERSGGDRKDQSDDDVRDRDESGVIHVRTWRDAEQMSFTEGDRITLTDNPLVRGRIFEFTRDWDIGDLNEIDIAKCVKRI